MKKELFFFLKKIGFKNILFLIFIVIINAFFELISIASIFPLLQFLINPNWSEVKGLNFFEEILIKLQFESVLFLILSIFIILFILRLLVRFFNIWFNANLFYKLHVSWANELLKNYLSKNYLFYKKKNSSILIRNVNEEVIRLMNVSLMPFILIISDIIIMLPILLFLIYLNYQYVILILAIFLTVSFLIFKFINPLIKRWGEIRVIHSAHKYKTLIQSLRNIKDIILTNKQNYFVKNFSNENEKVSKANRNYSFTSIIPKLFLEFFLLIALVFFVIINILNQNSLENTLPILAIFFASAIRLMPITTSTVKNYQLLKFGKKTLGVLYFEFKNIKYKDYSNLKVEENQQIAFSKSIRINNISFSYKSKKRNKDVISNLNLKIRKGEFIGIKGESGAGKSTLMDLMLGLINPKKGNIQFDDKNLKKNLKSWQKIISHIPQEIVLMDDTIKKNIALGINESEIDIENLRKSIKLSRLSNFVNRLPKKLNTIIGEGGSKISGGEKQRIGIARALYRNSQVLFLDETTSSLDRKNEINFLKGISKLKKNKTIVLISHSLSALSYCDKVYELKKGKLVKI